MYFSACIWNFELGELNLCRLKNNVGILFIFRYEITKLEKDQEEVKKNLKLIESRSNQSRDEHLTEELEELGRKNG